MLSQRAIGAGLCMHSRKATTLRIRGSHFGDSFGILRKVITPMPLRIGAQVHPSGCCAIVPAGPYVLMSRSGARRVCAVAFVEQKTQSRIDRVATCTFISAPNREEPQRSTLAGRWRNDIHRYDAITHVRQGLFDGIVHVGGLCALGHQGIIVQGVFAGEDA